jgi:4-diphosphocytidyl-2-C-methyl-D-erythritol kinase
MIAEFAPAKINLTLHVTGQRADGYHLLDSLVVFAEVGDTVSVAPADRLGFCLTGPKAQGLSAGPDNLVLRAAAFLSVHRTAAITLDKYLPVSSGIGGGSADAAACLRALAMLWDMPLPDPSKLLALGADVPVCLAGRPCRMRGVGEKIDPLVHPLPPAFLVLVNPGIALSTPAVFRAMTRRDNPPMPASLPKFTTLDDLVSFLADCRNDMQQAAVSLAPDIAGVLQTLAQLPGCKLARMSGSGATCFGIFPDAQSAHAATTALKQVQPTWWVAGAAMRTAQIITA